MKPDK
jgi:hypothetical protein